MSKRSIRLGLSLLLVASLVGCDELSSLTTVPDGSGLKGLARVGTTNAVTERTTSILTSYPLGGVNVDFLPEKAFDGNPGTSWSSLFYFDDEWIGADLGEAKRINQVKLTWSEDYGRNYRIEVSSDREKWQEVARKEGGTGGTETLTFDETSARYVRMRGAGRAASAQRYVLNEFEVTGPGSTTNLALNKPAEASSSLYTYFQVSDRDKAIRLMEAADALYKAGQYEQAFQGYQAIMSEMGMAMQQDRYVFDEIRYHMRAADFRRKNGAFKAPRRLSAAMSIWPKVETTMPRSANDSTRVDVSRTLREEQIPKIKDGFFWFSESTLALTEGQVEWELETVRMEAPITNVSEHIQQGYTDRFHAIPEVWKLPAADRAGLDRHHDADLHVILWPGTNHPTAPTTNGGQTTIAVYKPDGGYVTRPAIFSSADNFTWMIHDNNAAFFHHEFVHALDEAYKELPFPKYHAAARHADWPGQFEGRSESEFTEQIYRGYMLPNDKLARMGPHASGQAVTPTAQPTETPVALPTETPVALPTETPAEPVVEEPVLPEPEPETFEVARAIDQNSDTRWATTAGSTHWLMLDFGTRRDLGLVDLQWDDEYASSYVFQAWINRRWVTVASRSRGYGDRERLRFSRKGARYWRLYVRRAAQSSGVALRELRTYTTSDTGENFSASATVSASSER